MKYLLPLCLLLTLSSHSLFAAKTPDHAMVMVFDQMRPDYVERFDLKNFKRLIAMSRNYPRAYTGHSASITIISHSVISTGLLPKDLPWVDDYTLDSQGIFGPKGTPYQATKLSLEQLLKAFAQLPQENLLPARIKKKFGRKVFAVGEKDYAAIAMGNSTADTIITMKRNAEGRCKPHGVNIPEYITSNDRYTVDCSEKLGTKDSFYPLDGNHFYPGKDPAHLGGDIWTADIALDIMEREDWGGLLLTFGAIDKFAHMTGEPDGDMPLAFEPPAKLKEIAQIADAQLGKILDYLTAKKLLERTAIIITADHGGQSDWTYLGNNNSPDIGELANVKHESEESPFWIQRLKKTRKIKRGFADTSIRLWLEDNEPESEEIVLKYLREVSGLTQIFRKRQANNKFYYEEIYKNMNRQPKAFQTWAKRHNLELVNTMASEHGPDLIAALADNVGFSKLGDHGGLQEKVQRIPMIIYNPAGKKGVDNKELRLVDVASELTKILDLPQISPK